MLLIPIFVPYFLDRFSCKFLASSSVAHFTVVRKSDFLFMFIIFVDLTILSECNWLFKACIWDGSSANISTFLNASLGTLDKVSDSA